MSTRTRIILRFQDGSFLFGAAAVRNLITNALPNGFMGAQLPPQWPGMNKKSKLQWLASKLRYGFSLELFQEPKNTRKKCSVYWQARVKKPPLPAQVPAWQVPYDPPPPAPPLNRMIDVVEQQQPGQPVDVFAQRAQQVLEARRKRAQARQWHYDDGF